MAAPLLHHNRQCLLSIFSRQFDSNARCVSILKKFFAQAKAASRKETNNTPGDVHEPIIIPDKIERSPTAILEALAKTARIGVNKPLYQSIDDPALVSRSDGLLKNHLAAYDNGRKAAQAMIAMNPEYYTHFWDEPLPKTFDTVFTGYDHEGPSEEALLERIQRRKVTEAVDMYKAIKSQGTEISQSALEDMIDLLAVFNHQDLEDVSELSNFIMPAFEMESPFPVSTWPKGNLSEDIFLSLPEKTARAYCSLIRGMAVNNDKAKAFEMFKEARAANVPVDVFTYNRLLSIVSLDMESMDDIIKELEYVLKDMAACDVSPNVETFNSVLRNCRRISRWRGTKQYALSILSEMKACGIEPSLGTWTEILNIFYYHKVKAVLTPDLFENMLDVIEGKSYEYQVIRDTQFFRTAIRVISTHLPDSKLALRLHKILKHHRNFDLLGNRQSRFAYFKELFLLIAPVEHTDDVMAIYNDVVPYLFMPHLDVYKLLFENIELFDTYHYLPQMCADIDGSNIFQEKGSVQLFKLMGKQKQEPKLQQQFCDIATAYLQRWDESKLNRIRPYLDGSVIGDMMMVFLHGDQVTKAKAALEVYRSDRQLQNKDPSDDELQSLAKALISSNDLPATKDLLTLMHNLGCENTPDLVTKCLETFELSDQERNYMKGLASPLDSGSSSDSDSD